MEITHEVERMKKVACPKGHGPAELPQEGNWTQVKEIRDISGLSHGIGWCAPQQGCCKLTLNVKNGVIQEALVETTGCTGATHGAAVAGEHLPGKTLLEALNTHLACDAINVAMREIFKQMVYGRTQTAFRKRSAHRRFAGGPGQGSVQPVRFGFLHPGKRPPYAADGRGLCAGYGPE